MNAGGCRAWPTRLAGWVCRSSRGNTDGEMGGVGAGLQEGEGRGRLPWDVGHRSLAGLASGL